MTTISQMVDILNQHTAHQVHFDNEEQYVAVSFDSLLVPIVGEIRLYVLGNNRYKVVFDSPEANTIMTIGTTKGVMNGNERKYRVAPFVIELDSIEKLKYFCFAFDDDASVENTKCEFIRDTGTAEFCLFGEGNLSTFFHSKQVM